MNPRDELARYHRRPQAEDDEWADEPEDVENDTRLALYDAYEAAHEDADDADLRRLDHARDLGYRTVAERRASEREELEDEITRLEA